MENSLGDNIGTRIFGQENRNGLQLLPAPTTQAPIEPEFTSRISDTRALITEVLGNANISDVADEKLEKYRDATLEYLTDGLSPADKKLFLKANFDPQTGVMNRRGFLLLDEYVSMQGDKEPFCLMILDGDHFGAFNSLGKENKVGRAIADVAIKLLAQYLGEMVIELRKNGNDIHLIRMGGEEFVIIGKTDEKILKEKISTAKEQIKSKIRYHMPPDVLGTTDDPASGTLVRLIQEEKYPDRAGKVESQIHSEIGGSTTALTQFDPTRLHAYFKKKLGKVPAPEKMRIAVLQAVDNNLIRGKTKKRGGIVEERRENGGLSPTNEGENRRSDSPFQNELTEYQNSNLSQYYTELKKKVSTDHRQHIQLENILANLPQRYSEELRNFLITPRWNNSELAALAEKIGKEEEVLRNLKRKVVDFNIHWNTYSGAATFTHFQDKLADTSSEFSSNNARKIEIESFKSFNETLGHLFGDAYIMAIYQNVIKLAIDETLSYNREDSDLIISQRGPDYYYCFRDNVDKAKKKDFEERMSELYEKHLEKFCKMMDSRDMKSGTPPAQSYEEKRHKWIVEHQKWKINNNNCSLIFSNYIT